MAATACDRAAAAAAGVIPDGARCEWSIGVRSEGWLETGREWGVETVENCDNEGEGVLGKGVDDDGMVGALSKAAVLG